MYDIKLKNLQDRLAKERLTKVSNQQELREMLTKVSALSSRTVELEASNASLQKQMMELQQKMDNLAARMRAKMALKDTEVKGKEEQMDQMTQDYKDLMEIKIALEMEIVAYHKLFKVVERWNL